MPVTVQFFEGKPAAGQLLDTLEMAAAPQIGATIVFEIEGDRRRPLEVVSVQHQIDVRRRDDSIESREIAIRCGTRPAGCD